LPLVIRYKKEQLKIHKSKRKYKGIIMFEMYFKAVFVDFADFDGRARRKEYWMFFLGNVVVCFILSFFLSFIPTQLANIFGGIYSLALLIPSLAVSVRRMHDVGHSGWYAIIPLYGLILSFAPGDDGENEYGSDPKNEIEDLEEIGKE
jgi:uncharacterized membrane protein YhaH (DUF805 family)